MKSQNGIGSAYFTTISFLKLSLLFCYCNWPMGMKLKAPGGQKESDTRIRVTRLERTSGWNPKMARSGIQMRAERFSFAFPKAVECTKWTLNFRRRIYLPKWRCVENPMNGENRVEPWVLIQKLWLTRDSRTSVLNWIRAKMINLPGFAAEAATCHCHHLMYRCQRKVIKRSIHDSMGKQMPFNNNSCRSTLLFPPQISDNEIRQRLSSTRFITQFAFRQYRSSREKHQTREKIGNALN